MGQRDRFSNYDIEKINRMYKCKRGPWPGFGLTGIGSTNQHSPRPTPPRPSNNNNNNLGSVHSVHSIGTNTGSSQRDRNPIGEIFKAYTSPQFWQRLFSAWLFSQPQPRYQQQIYSDSPYTNYPYFVDQRYYG